MTSKISDQLKIKKNISFFKEIQNGSFYFFTGKDTSWSPLEDSTDFEIPTPYMDVYSSQQELKDILGLKNIDFLYDFDLYSSVCLSCFYPHISSHDS
jgi:hypothetical protein